MVDEKDRFMCQAFTKIMKTSTGLVMFLALSSLLATAQNRLLEPGGSTHARSGAENSIRPMAATAESAAPVFETSRYVTGLDPAASATGDFDGDRNADIVTANFHDGTVGVLLGKGNGTFKPVIFSPAGTYPAALAVGDFNGDGNQDLVLADEAANEQGTSSVVFLPGNGNGTFGAPVTIATFSQTYLNLVTSIVAADFNGDGKLDFAVAIGYNGAGQYPGEVILFLGQGNGTFQQSTVIQTTGYPYSLAAGDLNGDGAPDLIVNNVTYSLVQEYGIFASTLWVYMGIGNGAFESPTQYPLDLAGEGSILYASSVALADMNGDGTPDLIAGTQVLCNGIDVYAYVYVALGNGDGTFQNPGPYIASYGNGQVTVADFNGDGEPDVAVPDENVGVDILFNAGFGSGSLGSPSFYNLTGAPLDTIVGAIGTASFEGQLPGSADLFVTDTGNESYGVGFDVYVMQNLDATKIKLSANPKSAEPGETVTFTADVTAAVKAAGVAAQPTGTVTFENGSTNLGTATLVNGVATLQYSQLPVGSSNIVAAYSGNGNYNPATSAVVTERVK
jgi:trimeric autotransporter adhesin